MKRNLNINFYFRKLKIEMIKMINNSSNNDLMNYESQQFELLDILNIISFGL